MNIYFDTSVINDIAYDSKSNNLVNAIINEFDSHISMLNIVEILSASDPRERAKLLNIARTISKGSYPIAGPYDILNRSLEAYLNAAKSMEFSISEQDRGIWAVLMNPELADETARAEVSDWKRQHEDWLQSAHTSSRPSLQDLSKLLPDEDRKTLQSRASFLRYYANHEGFLQEILEELVQATPYSKQYAGRELDILEIEPWRFYLSAIAVSIFNRSIQVQGYKKRKNAGTVDTEQAVYLAATDVFVTSDIAQEKMLRLVKCFGSVHREVWSYRKLGSKLGLA